MVGVRKHLQRAVLPARKGPRNLASRVWTRMRNTVRTSAWLRRAVLCITLLGGGALGQTLLIDHLGHLGRWLGGLAMAIAAMYAMKVYDAVTRRAEARAAAQRVEEISAPAGLLDPKRQVVGFVGRKQELAALVGWCEDGSTKRVRLVTGPGGIGKSRLAMQLYDVMAARRDWRCVRVADGTEATALSTVRKDHQGRLLLVIDYAETRTGLDELLREVVADSGTVVRVLLLSRSVGEWWGRLKGSAPAIRALLADAYDDRPLSATVDAKLSDKELVRQAVPLFADKLGIRSPRLRRARFSVDTGGGRVRILDLHAAALVIALKAKRGNAEPFGGVRVRASEVLDELLGHEERFWQGTAQAAGLLEGPQGMTTAALRRTVAAGCLLGAATEDEARDLLKRIPGTIPTLKTATWLRDLYPPSPEAGASAAGWLGTLQPDVLAEHLTFTELTRSDELATNCLTALNGRQTLRAITLLSRATDHPDTGSLLERAVPRLTSNIAELPPDLGLLSKIANAIPYRSEVLAEASVKAIERILSLLPNDHSAVRAHWLVSLGTSLEYAGRPAEAGRITANAVDVYRRLAETEREHLPKLATALSNLGNALTRLGRPSEALEAAMEATQIHKELADAEPDEYLSDLAASFNNLGEAYFELNKPIDALVEIQEAIRIYRELAESQPDRFWFHLASTLYNRSNILSEVGRPADALPAAKEAVDIYRKLAEAQPGRYRSGLAKSLHELGDVLSRCDRLEDALPRLQEAREIFRDLDTAHPDRHRPYRIETLDLLEWLHRHLGQTHDADEVRHEVEGLKAAL